MHRNLNSSRKYKTNVNLLIICGEVDTNIDTFDVRNLIDGSIIAMSRL